MHNTSSLGKGLRLGGRGKIGHYHDENGHRFSAFGTFILVILSIPGRAGGWGKKNPQSTPKRKTSQPSLCVRPWWGGSTPQPTGLLGIPPRMGGVGQECYGTVPSAGPRPQPNWLESAQPPPAATISASTARVREKGPWQGQAGRPGRGWGEGGPPLLGFRRLNAPKRLKMPQKENPRRQTVPRSSKKWTRSVS